MGDWVASALDVLCVLVAAAASVYLILAIWCVRRFGRPDIMAAGTEPPPLSVLKPLCGDEPRLYDCLRSFCVQDYPGLQIVCGMAEPAPGATAIIQRLAREFSERDIRLVVDPTMHGSNRKVSNLINMERLAKYEVLVISDSDVALESEDFLRRVAASLADPRVGAVTCPYRGRSEPGIVNRLGTMLIDDRYFPEALIAALRPIDFCLGPVTAVRRGALAAVGGLKALANHIADDHMLGQLIARSGRRVVLAAAVADTTVAESFLSLARRELRWARTIRATQPIGHLASVATHGLPVLLCLVLLDPGLVGEIGLLWLLTLRLALRAAVHERLGQRGPAMLWLAPLRELLSFLVWLASFGGRRVVWRGRDFTIRADGELAPQAAPAYELAPGWLDKRAPQPHEAT
jgi:ceramide glucosyltransferase